MSPADLSPKQLAFLRAVAAAGADGYRTLQEAAGTVSSVRRAGLVERRVTRRAGGANFRARQETLYFATEAGRRLLGAP